MKQLDLKPKHGYGKTCCTCFSTWADTFCFLEKVSSLRANFILCLYYKEGFGKEKCFDMTYRLSACCCSLHCILKGRTQCTKRINAALWL